MLNRRTFLKTSAGVLPMAAAINAFEPTSIHAVAENVLAPERGSAPRLTTLAQRLPAIDPATEPWQKRIRRVGQTNMTEHDPAVINIQEWADYWHSAKADIVFISVTGI